MKTHPSVAGVDRIEALDDVVIRNLRITQSYHELSGAMTARLGPEANWCTFATWASKQAGQTIRGEDLSRALEQFLAAAPDTREAAGQIETVSRGSNAPPAPKGIRQIIWETLDPAAITARASDAVGRGNRKVFAEIGREFARFLDTCGHDQAYDARNIDLFCAGLRPGGPPDGQDYLQQAFRCYYRAMFEPDTKIRAELILLANLDIGFHEQTRLQPEIREALEASLPEPAQFTRRLLGAFFPYRGWLHYLAFLFLRLLKRSSRLDEAIQQYYSRAQRQIRVFLTDRLMNIGFPHGQRLRLGADLQAGFPDNLKQITLPELQALLAQIDPTPDSLQASGATDWAELADRIHFIADMFRCYQERRDLLEPPFNPEQVTAMQEGRLPEGDL